MKQLQDLWKCANSTDRNTNAWQTSWRATHAQPENHASHASHLLILATACVARVPFTTLLVQAKEEKQIKLLGPVDNVDLRGIHWVIVSGESGPGARLLDEKWVLEIRDRCIQSNVPFFFKQWGGVNKKRNGRLLQGRVWDEMPRIKKAV